MFCPGHWFRPSLEDIVHVPGAGQRTRRDRKSKPCSRKKICPIAVELAPPQLIPSHSESHHIFVAMPAFDSSGKHALSGLSTTLTATAEVFQPGNSGNAGVSSSSSSSSSSSAPVSPFSSTKDGNLSCVATSAESPFSSPNCHKANRYAFHRGQHHHGTAGYTNFKRLFYPQQQQPPQPDYHGLFESTSILKVHDELPQQAIQAWERYCSERSS